MIVNLTVLSPQGEARAFEFRRRRISVGAGSKNDLVIASENEAVRVLALDASASGVRVTVLSDAEPITVVLPEDPMPRPADPELLLPPGSRILVGDPATELVIDRVRKADALSVEVVAPFPPSAPSEFIAELPAGVRDETLRVAYDVASVSEPRRVLAELVAVFERVYPGLVSRLQLALPIGEDQPWDAIQVFGPADPKIPIESLGLGEGALHEALGRSEVVRCSNRAGSVLVLPATAGGRLRAAVVAECPGDAAEAFAAMRPLVTAFRPLLLAFATHFARLAEMEALEEENRYFKDRQRREYLFKELVTESPAMRRVHRRLGEFVGTDAPVLLAGEAGTGKELLARALHHLGARANGVLVSQHCAALDEDALDFELFGYARRGEGTAVASRRGIFELANGGTVFLDEVHALSPRLQTKLYRMLVEGEVFRIGESLARPVDVRIVAASHLDLMALADEGRFRRDLAIAFTRNVLEVPPLRDRREDIAPLVGHFVRKWARRYRKQVESVDPETLAWLQKLRWPGNVRELLTVIERAVLGASPDQLTLRRSDFELS